ncbi:hypothetical protein ACGFSI_12280 [Streptomyces virginiae]|uniref:hypothetical protein n=1 Tax=Streptomyces virginiae TaxID=1961 RepID=UPI0037249D8C
MNRVQEGLALGIPAPPVDAHQRPSAARIYRMWFGAEDALPADQDLARKILNAFPRAPAGVHRLRCEAPDLVDSDQRHVLHAAPDTSDWDPLADLVHRRTDHEKQIRTAATDGSSLLRLAANPEPDIQLIGMWEDDQLVGAFAISEGPDAAEWTEDVRAEPS